MGDTSPDRRYSCGLFSAVFGRRNPGQRRTTPAAVNGGESGKPTTTTSSEALNSKRRRGVSVDGEILQTTSSSSSSATRSSVKPTIQNNQTTTSSISKVTPTPTTTNTQQGYYGNQGRKVPKEAIGISGELESMIMDHQKSKGSHNLVRASSSNVMLLGNLGNLRQAGGESEYSYHVVDHIPKRKEEVSSSMTYSNNNNNNGTKKKDQKSKAEQGGGGSLCRAISTRMDPEQLKIMGNEDYKNGNFAEALASYDAAIAIDPNKASYRSNRSAALTALGRILEAVLECREAIRIEPNYHRAHHRLGNLYLRLGETDKAQYHFKLAGPEADPDEIAKVKTLQVLLNKCTEARRLRDWNTLRKETESAISAGADSAPQIFALQAEALLKIRRHQDAEIVMSKGSNFGDDELSKYFGPLGFANLLVTRAQVHMAAGRFDDALEEAERAVKLDSNNREASMVMRRARGVSAARSHGNELFRACRFSEALGAYGEGLEHEPCNAILLCNRAACRSKLGQFERAVEDCSAALTLRPSYCKARLRRADCNAKLERWEAAIQDYQVLLRETPEDEKVRKGLLDAQKQLRKQRGEEM